MKKLNSIFNITSVILKKKQFVNRSREKIYKKSVRHKIECKFRTRFRLSKLR